MTSPTKRRICQTCGRAVIQLSNHVNMVHKTSITELIAEGKWKNESIYEDETFEQKQIILFKV